MNKNTMKKIMYVMVSDDGKIKSFRFRCQQNESDSTNLSLFEPGQLRGNAQTRLRKLLDNGYSLSNWHVIQERENRRSL